MDESNRKMIEEFCKPCQFYESGRPCRVVTKEPNCQLFWAQRRECKRASMYDVNVILRQDTVQVDGDQTQYQRTDLEGIKKAAAKWKEQHPVLQFKTEGLRTGIKF